MLILPIASKSFIQVTTVQYFVVATAILDTRADVNDVSSVCCSTTPMLADFLFVPIDGARQYTWLSETGRPTCL